MFTGIVQAMGRVAALERRPGGATLALETELASRLGPGESVAVDGVCLTVTAAAAGRLGLDLMPETLRRTHLGALRPGQTVNLEPPLRAGDPLGGHFVQGHVDTTARLLDRQADGEAIVLTIEAPAEVERYMVPQGFVAVDGVSLTVVDCLPAAFRVSLVRATQERTSLAGKPVGARLNLEVDLLGKYVAALLSQTRQVERPGHEAATEGPG